MNRSLFTLALLMSIPLFATFQDSQNKLKDAQRRIDDTLKKVQALDKKIEQTQTRLSGVQGQKEYSADMNKCKQQVSADVTAQNRALDEHRQAIKEYQQLLLDVSRDHDVNTVGNKHELIERKDTTPATKTQPTRRYRKK